MQPGVWPTTVPTVPPSPLPLFLVDKIRIKWKSRAAEGLWGLGRRDSSTHLAQVKMEAVTADSRFALFFFLKHQLSLSLDCPPHESLTSHWAWDSSSTNSYLWSSFPSSPSSSSPWLLWWWRKNTLKSLYRFWEIVYKGFFLKGLGVFAKDSSVMWDFKRLINIFAGVLDPWVRWVISLKNLGRGAFYVFPSHIYWKQEVIQHTWTRQWYFFKIYLWDYYHISAISHFLLGIHYTIYMRTN